MKDILVSPEDRAFLLLNWRVTPRGYVRRDWHEDGAHRYEMLHRLVTGAIGGQIVDHVNGDPLDNRRENLRICSHGQNMQNRRRHVNNSTGAKGVYPYKGRFRAQIRTEGRKILIGAFDTVDAAAAAYAAAARKFHGAFAREA